MPISRRTLTHWLAALSAGGIAARVRAQGQPPDWPTRPLRIIVPATAGSSLDGLARLVADPLQVALKQPVVVDNRPGANQTIGISAMTSSPADGLTILFTSTELVRVPLLYPSIKYDPFKEFMPLWQIASTSTFLASPTSVPATHWQEFVELARNANPPLTYGSPGQGSGGHFYGQLLAKAAGIRLDHVPYRGEVPLIPDLLSGRISAGWISGNLLTQFSREGKLRALGGGSITKRSATLPNVPTFPELGYPELGIAGFIGFFVRAGTPPAMVQRLSAELNRIGLRPDLREKIETFGFEATGPSTPADFLAVMKTSHEGWVQAIKAVDIKLD